MDIPRFRFDYSFLDLPSLAEKCITPDEVEDVFYNIKTFYGDWHKTDQFGYMLGYSLKNKFLSFTLEFGDGQQIVRLIDVYLPHAQEIGNWYFGVR